MRRKVQIQLNSPAGPSKAADGPLLPPEALSVSEFTRQVKQLLEGAFSRAVVYGEVIGLSRPASGHLYFTLKDERDGEKAQIAVVMWRDRAAKLRFPLDDGLLVVVEGRMTVYEPRGSYQIVAESVRPAGQGTLLLALERLKERLWKEGLFDPARKRPIPFLPRSIGIITSASGAAVHDVLKSIFRKFPAAVRLLPVRVQGEGSAEDIVSAFQILARQPDLVEVAILTRGGGSLEDLWTFNEEKVVRAVAAAPVPVISAVGHEVDVTLSDLAADVRAQTPTQAGELVVPDLGQILEALDNLRRRLEADISRKLEARFKEAAHLGRSISIQRLFELAAGHFEEVGRLGEALKKTLYNRLREWEDLFLLNTEKLSALNPLNILRRGYSMTMTPDGKVIRSVSSVKIGEEIAVVLAEGELGARVSAIRPSHGPEPLSLTGLPPGFSP